MEKKNYVWIAEVTLICIAAITLIPIIIASGYTFSWSDDFSVINESRTYGTNVVIAALKYAVNFYFTWQGTYTSSVLMVLISPLNGQGHIWLRVVMLLNIILFCVSLWAFINAVCKSFNVSRIKYSTLFFSLCIIGIFGFTSWTEVFNWFVGATVYSFPMSFCLLGLAIALRLKSIKGACAAGIFMFMASGGGLEIAGIGCFVLLGICTVKWMLKIGRMRDCIVFCCAFLGALINTLAPGNYIRHAAFEDSGLHVGTAMISSTLEVLQNVEELLFDTPCVILILVAVVLGAAIGKTKKIQDTKVMLTIILFCIVTPFVSYFPVFVGYGASESIPNRCKFVETVVIITVFMIIATVVGCAMSEKLVSLRTGEIFVGSICFLIVMSNISPSWRISQLVPAQMWKEIAYGSYKEYYEKVNKIYDLIENDTNEDVFIYDMPEEVPHFSTLELKEDMSYWVNSETAKYFGKKSVQCVSEPLRVQKSGEKIIRVSQATFEGKSGYLSIYKLDENNQIVEELQEIQPLNSNILICMEPEETGKIAIYLYEDPEGMIQIDGKEIEY